MESINKYCFWTSKHIDIKVSHAICLCLSLWRFLVASVLLDTACELLLLCDTALMSAPETGRLEQTWKVGDLCVKYSVHIGYGCWCTHTPSTPCRPFKHFEFWFFVLRVLISTLRFFLQLTRVQLKYLFFLQTIYSCFGIRLSFFALLFLPHSILMHAIALVIRWGFKVILILWRNSISMKFQIVFSCGTSLW